MVADEFCPYVVAGVKGNAPVPALSVPQERTPLVDFTSQAAAPRPATVRFVVEAVPFTVKSAAGFVVFTPTLPAFVIMKAVAVEEPTTNSVLAPPATGFTESVANGEEVPIPRIGDPVPESENAGMDVVAVPSTVVVDM